MLWVVSEVGDNQKTFCSINQNEIKVERGLENVICPPTLFPGVALTVVFDLYIFF